MNIPHSALILRSLGDDDRGGLDAGWNDSVLKTGASSAAVVRSVVSGAVELTSVCSHSYIGHVVRTRHC